jgi:N-methylhydantoinase A
MQSGGGLFDVETARSQCIQMLESGPAAGVVASREMGRAMNLDNVICFDMGGTTAKACVLQSGTAAMSADYFVGGYNEGLVIRIPVLDIKEVGTGGGSIAWIDGAGALHADPKAPARVRAPRVTGWAVRAQRSPTRTSCSATCRRRGSTTAACSSMPQPLSA